MPLYFEELSPPAKVTLANVVLNATALLTMMDAIHTRIEAAPALKPAHTVPALEPAGEWKKHARAEARKFIKQKAASDLFPPQMNVADHVAKHLKVQGIFGSDGKPLSGATIKRHALKGISSAKKKAQSTAPKRGK